MITKEYLTKIEPLTIFQQGVFFNGEYGVKAPNCKMVKWIAIKGGGYHDWAIYADDVAKSAEEVAETGQKLYHFYVGEVVNATTEALSYYRR